jgi:NAD(P)-dependent dehydrogenase (short-subunit alcohol dehydrogenase family)
MSEGVEMGPALVTGAARRIGLAVAQGLARAGRPVVLHASPRSLSEAEAAAAEAEFGPFTLLVNNASIYEPDAADSFALDGFERHMAINLRAPLLLSRAFAARLPQGEHGALVNVVDERVYRLTPQDFTYTLSKAALWTATRTMAQAFAPRIRVNAVGPGPVLPNNHVGDAGFAEEVAALPLAEPVAVESIVEAVLYLSTARHVTGQMIAVDSGQHLA